MPAKKKPSKTSQPTEATEMSSNEKPAESVEKKPAEVVENKPAEPIKEELLMKSENDARRLCYRDASSKAITAARKTFSLEPTEAKKSIEERGILMAFSGMSCLVVLFDKFAISASEVPLMKKLIDESPQMTVVVQQEKADALLEFAEKKAIKLGDFDFSYVDIRNAMKIVKNSAKRYTFHLFYGVVVDNEGKPIIEDGKELVRAVVAIQNPNLETVIALSLENVNRIHKAVTLEQLRDDYLEYLARTKKQSITKFYGGKADENADDVLRRWSDFEEQK